ncbi:hypothetical protein NHX12_007204 [Muraenolepis orangiensis]|uniref:Uncharacterized protein n=1 Tax=Muraenolepis orangiensis TaxID=630683 RepID=A0A9Q0IBC6_9TELE|nr:hypothetical protein NHX12_007204 [Muraenolepis orangiensis]
MPGVESWYQRAGTRELVPESWYQRAGTRELVPESWYQRAERRIVRLYHTLSTPSPLEESEAPCCAELLVIPWPLSSHWLSNTSLNGLV